MINLSLGIRDIFSAYWCTYINIYISSGSAIYALTWNYDQKEDAGETTVVRIMSSTLNKSLILRCTNCAADKYSRCR